MVAGHSPGSSGVTAGAGASPHWLGPRALHLARPCPAAPGFREPTVGELAARDTPRSGNRQGRAGKERCLGQGLQSSRRRNNSGSKQRSHPSNGPRCRRGTCGHVSTCVCMSGLNTCPDSPDMRQADSPGLLTSDGLQSPM